MLDRIYEQQNPLTIALNTCGRTELQFTSEQWVIIGQLIDVLVPFEAATTMSSYEQNVSISFVAPMIWNMKNKHLIIKETDLPVIQELKQRLGVELVNRFPDINSVGNIAMKSSMLDPRSITNYIF